MTDYRMTNCQMRIYRMVNDEGGTLKMEGFGIAPGLEAAIDFNKDLLQKETSRPVYDLAERTALFGENIIRFAKRVPREPVNNRLIHQLVGAGTSIGANYCEADDGVSKADFKHR